MNYWTLIDRHNDSRELKNVYDDPSYAEARKSLHAELDRLRSELKVPVEDPPGSFPSRGGAKDKGKPKYKAATK